MKKYISFLISSWAGIIIILSGSLTVAQDLPGDTLQLPFTEDWSSGTFTTNHWSFPDGQGPWAVDSYYGDPYPSARFYGFPTIMNYSYKLYSTWIDGKKFRCSDIWLDFDLKLFSLVPSGTEKLTIGKGTDTSFLELYIIKNDSAIGWQHYHLHLGFANNHYFKIGFVASGENSSSFHSWCIDNIHLDYVCQPPSAFNSVTDYLADTVQLFWTPPSCGTTGIQTDFIYDDGTMENGWGVTYGNEGWFGNEFPIFGMTGTIQSITALWWRAPCGPQYMTFDIFDANRNLVGSTQTFMVMLYDWVTVPVNDVPFSGTFYVMAHWTPAPGFCYYLGIDENDPAATLNLAWYSDGVTWQKVSSIPLGSPGVFVLRVTAMINDGMDLINLDPAPGHPDTPEVSDSMVIAGYNVYRKAPVNDSSFIRINADPVIDSQYIDNQFYGTYAGYYYYVTCLYNLASTNNFLCESRGTDTLFVSLIVGVGENKERTSLKVFPVPANSIINIKSDKIITGVEIDDHLGTIKMVEGNLRNHEYSIPVERLYPGLYFLKVMTGQDVITRKILVMR